MNAWGVLITGIGFLLLYMGIKNKDLSALVTEFRPQGSTSGQPSAPLQNTTPLTPGSSAGTPGGTNNIPGFFGGTNAPPMTPGNIGGLGLG